MVGAAGFEPATARTPSVCATRLRYAPTLILKLREFGTAVNGTTSHFFVSARGSSRSSAEVLTHKRKCYAPTLILKLREFGTAASGTTFHLSLPANAPIGFENNRKAVHLRGLSEAKF